MAARRQLLSLEGVSFLGFRGDGRFQVGCLRGQSVQIWECLASDVLRIPRGPGYPLHHVGFSPDERWVPKNTTDFHWLYEQDILADLKAKRTPGAGRPQLDLDWDSPVAADP